MQIYTLALLLAAAPQDFNGDGYADLAVGTPFEDVGAAADAGAVTVLYGSAAGLTAAGSQQWTQDSPGVPDSAEAGDQFGVALSCGDFDGDGYDDLAVGSNREDLTAVDVGAVHVLFGSAAGLTGTGSAMWYQGQAGNLETAETSDQFGAALSSADYDADGWDDLAIGVPYEDVGSVDGAGQVMILFGSVLGLTNLGAEIWNQNSAGVADSAEYADDFGYRLASGDFNGDGRGDLAVGLPYENVGATSDAGAVCILFGTDFGLTGEGSQFLSQGNAGIADSAEANDSLGWALAAGDFDGDGYTDLAAGVPLEDLGSAEDAGAVHVLYGSPSGLTGTGDQLLTQTWLATGNLSESNDWFGYALAAADCNGDGRDDLAMGAPFETMTVASQGAVLVAYGTGGGFVAGGQNWTQDSGGVPDAAEMGDMFGQSLAAGRYAGSFGAVAIGVPSEDVPVRGASNIDCGALNVVYGGAVGLSGSGAQFWHQNSTSVPDSNEIYDRLGATL